MDVERAVLIIQHDRHYRLVMLLIPFVSNAVRILGCRAVQHQIKPFKELCVITEEDVPQGTIVAVVTQTQDRFTRKTLNALNLQSEPAFGKEVEKLIGSEDFSKEIVVRSAHPFDRSAKP